MANNESDFFDLSRTRPLDQMLWLENALQE
ncbi:hypothetical protein MJO28_001611 [Puccinia striiformis f. sp. tritici]|uniref:Uncharacterized protein n=2 Tax=Puccinia striiformis TaxID=27350 RepID=A0A2S4WBX2_9BASI|nr:hypothetical protein MJO28_001611 [Puccinia striiformis f. sp. tritici]KAI7965908.1 hypothetical protein MJO29_001656 [Puccinia striiformis f. sp. tritici]POW19253.1 hypothetical protein PSHT_04866 [Puccinia striiformis]